MADRRKSPGETEKVVLISDISEHTFWENEKDGSNIPTLDSDIGLLGDTASQNEGVIKDSQTLSKGTKYSDGNATLPDAGAVEVQDLPIDDDIRRHVSDHTALLMSYNLEVNPSNGSSDYAYVQALHPLTSGDTEPTYTYPDQLPSGLIFVDCVGWLPAEECMRYLMMGYRVWNEDGRRMHLAGDPTGYDGLKATIRYQKKKVCLQGADEIPDLYVQIKAGDLYQDPPTEDAQKTGMPWVATRCAPAFVNDPTNLMMQVQIAWIESRFKHSRPCYVRPQANSYVPHGGWKLAKTPLKELQNTRFAYNTITGVYPQVGVDLECLNIQYPPFKAAIEYENILTPPETDHLCSICRSLDFKEIFEWGLSDLEISFGSTEELLARRHCNFCRVLAGSCQDGLEFLQRIRQAEIGCPSRSVEPDFEYGEPIEVLLIRNPALCLSTKPTLVLKQSYHLEYLGPIVSMQTVRGDLVGKFEIVVSGLVDLSRLKGIIARCDSGHGPDCGRHMLSEVEVPFSKPTETFSIFLLNVKKMCIEETDINSVQYIALSYVWGRKIMLRLLQENCAAFQKPDSLRDVNLSRLIREVMAVVSGLGIEYLWVDALCIIQDDPDHQQAQIERMADIYGSAYLTIVALSGLSTESSLPGVSKPRPQLVNVVNGMIFVPRLSPLAWNAHNRIYEQRGWTFQERLVSRRCLFFTERQVYFECGQTSTSDREQNFPPNDRGRLRFPYNPLRTLSQQIKKTGASSATDSFSLSHLEFFCDIVSQYTARKLTYQSDIENAFLGIQDVFQSQLGWNFLAGIPIGIFEWALLWLPLGDLERRSWPISSNSEDGESRVQRPPSWSWLGWEGQVSYACYTYHNKPFLQNIKPRTSAFVVRSNSTAVSILREPSQIWQDATQAKISEQKHRNNEIQIESYKFSASRKATLPWLLDPSTVLHFEAETTSALIESIAFASHDRARGATLSSTSEAGTGEDLELYSPNGPSLLFRDGRRSSRNRFPSRGRSMSRSTSRSRGESEISTSLRALSFSCLALNESPWSMARSASPPMGMDLRFTRSLSRSRTHWRERGRTRKAITSDLRTWRTCLFRGRSRDDSRTRVEYTRRSRSWSRSGLTRDDLRSRRGRSSNETSSTIQRKYSESSSRSQSRRRSRRRDRWDRDHDQRVSLLPTSWDDDSSGIHPWSLPRRSEQRRFPLSIEWLNTGTAYGMLRHGLRHHYNRTVHKLAESKNPDLLELIAMADCDIQQTFRGGQFGEEKLFEQKEQIVLMLVLWNVSMEIAERIAIGSAPKREWEELAAETKRWKTIRLV